MRAVFIADAHLKCSTDERYSLLVNFLDEIREGKVATHVDSDDLGKGENYIDRLYFVGDLFDFWFCDVNRINPEFILIINKLVELQKAGIDIHLCEGNHDFFLREYFFDVLGMKVFEEWADLKMDNLRFLVGHGDTADSTNNNYLFFRKILRSRSFYRFQRFVPARVRWTLASLSSRASKKMSTDLGDLLAEKMLSFALDKFRQDYDAVIVGHCHKPVLRQYVVERKKKTFAAAGDWNNHYSFVYYQNKNFYLGYYR